MIVGEIPAPGHPVSGGPANATKRLVDGLVGAGVAVSVVAPAERDVPEERLHGDGATLIFVPHDQRYMIPRRMAPWRKAAVPVVESLRPDVVHGQGIVTGGVVAAGVRGDVPRVVTARGNARQDTLAAYHGTAGRIRAALRDRLIDEVIGGTDVVISVHPDWRVNLPRLPQHLVFIPNIVDDAFFSVSRTPTAGRVIYCGGNKRIKGYDVLEAAWPIVLQAIPDASLRLLGWPADTPPISGDAIEWRGVLGPEALAREMARAAVVVIPSRYEVSPIVLAEAWASGTPVVCTDAGGMASLAPGAARVVPTASVDALAQAIVETLAGDLDVAELVAAGRERAGRHRASAVVDAHVSLYASLSRGS